MNQMNYSFVTSVDFERNFKRLLRKYPSLRKDVSALMRQLRQNPTMGDDLGNNTRKVRMAIASKNRGKRAGARVITCNILVNMDNTDIYLLTIYDKSERENISAMEIQRIKQENGLIDE